jgi:RimJ/RimL family protein N-acetyltransferase
MAIVMPRQVTIKDGTGLWLRSAEPGDAQAVIDLREDLVVSNAFQVSSPQDKWTQEMALEKIANATRLPGHLWVVASPGKEPGSGVVGAISFRNGDRVKVEHHGTFGIGNLASWRGRGVGTVLIEALLDWAAEHNTIEKVCLGCFATNTKARKLYRRLGFRTEMRQKRFFKLAPGEYVDDIGMCMYVKPGVAPEGFNTWSPSRPSAAC